MLQKRFHMHCISEWIISNDVCPLCRRENPCEEKTHYYTLLNVFNKNPDDCDKEKYNLFNISSFVQFNNKIYRAKGTSVLLHHDEQMILAIANSMARSFGVVEDEQMVRIITAVLTRGLSADAINTAMRALNEFNDEHQN